MNWLEITIETSHDGIEPVCTTLAALGYDSLQIEDSDDFNDFVSRQKPMWQSVEEGLAESLQGVHRIRLYVAGEEGRQAAASVRAAMDSLRASFPAGLGALSVKTGEIKDDDWLENWKKYYKPIKIGRRVLIRPAWEPEDNPEGRVVFVCEPGVSFGTGDHATTSMCLELLDEWVRDGDSVADLGCGSGILSVTALLLGASEAVAVDIDPMAVDVAARNAELNGKSSMTVIKADMLAQDADELWRTLAGRDIVCANLVCELIVILAPKISDCVKPGGRLFASGILEGDALRARNALEAAGLRHINTINCGGWAALHMQK